MGDIGRESGSSREVALNVEKVLTGVKDNYRKHLQKVRGPDSADKIRASSHPPVSIPHRRDKSMKSTEELVKYFFNFVICPSKMIQQLFPATVVSLRFKTLL